MKNRKKTITIIICVLLVPTLFSSIRIPLIDANEEIIDSELFLENTLSTDVQILCQDNTGIVIDLFV